MYENELVPEVPVAVIHQAAERFMLHSSGEANPSQASGDMYLSPAWTPGGFCCSVDVKKGPLMTGRLPHQSEMNFKR